MKIVITHRLDDAYIEKLWEHAEMEQSLGDLLHRQSELAVNSPSLLRIAYLHLKTYEARRAREGVPSASAR
jgi:hypothetical protein